MAKRRLNGEGSITWRKDTSTMMGRVPHHGRRVPVFDKSKDELKRKIRDVLTKQDKGHSLVTSDGKYAP